MVYLVVAVPLKEGNVGKFIELFKSSAVATRQEQGCLQYIATVDSGVGLHDQTLDKNVVTILEKWESREALLKHLDQPNTKTYLEKEKALVSAAPVVKVLEEA